MKPKIFFIVMIVLVLILLTIFIIYAGPDRDGPSIKTPGSEWTVTRYTGDESTLYDVVFADRTSLRSEICLVRRNVITPAANSINIYSRDGLSLASVPRETRDSRDYYCYTPSQTYVRWGESSIITEYEEINMINYHTDVFDINSTLYKKIGDDWDNSVNTITLIVNEPDFVFKAIDNGTERGQVNDYMYKIESNLPIEQLNPYVYLIKENETSYCWNPFECQDVTITDPKYDFTDICFPDFNRTHITFNPNCTSTFSDDNKTLELFFKAEHNSTLGYTYIDPSVNFSTNSITSSDISILTDETFVIAYSDYTESDTTFIVYHINGSNLTALVDVDTSTTGILYPNQGASVSALNSTDFVIGWQDGSALGGDNEFVYGIYKSDGSTVRGEKKIFAPAIQYAWHSSLDVVALNETAFVYGFQNIQSGIYGRAKFQVKTNLDENLSSIVQVDTNIYGIADSEISLSAFPSTEFVYGFFDSQAQSVKFQVYHPNGTNSSPLKVVASGQGYGEHMEVSVFDDDDFAIAWFEWDSFPTPDDIRVWSAICNKNITCSSANHVQNIGGTINPNTAGYPVSVSGINTDGDYVVTWMNGSTSNKPIFGKIYHRNHTLIVQFDTLESMTSNKVMATEYAQGTSFCGTDEDSMIVSMTKYFGTGSNATWKGYHGNGTYWVDGNCAEVVADSCTYGGTGDYEPDCSDNCRPTADITVQDGFDVVFSGVGTYIFDEDIQLYWSGTGTLTTFSECVITKYKDGGYYHNP